MLRAGVWVCFPELCLEIRGAGERSPCLVFEVLAGKPQHASQLINKHSGEGQHGRSRLQFRKISSFFSVTAVLQLVCSQLCSSFVLGALIIHAARQELLFPVCPPCYICCDRVLGCARVK